MIVLDVYCAGEKPIKNINGLSLVEGMQNYGHKNVIYVDSSDKIKDAILHIKELSNNTLAMAVFMGAGDITTIAKDTLNNLNNN